MRSLATLCADLINRIDGLQGQLVHGKLHRFTFLRAGDFTGADVEMTLRRYGIRVWEREVSDPDEIALSVKQRQAVWAEYILCRAGVLLTSELLDKRNSYYRDLHHPNSMPRPWNEQGIRSQTLIDHLVEWLYRIVG
jgi:hypothetical protein